MPYSWDPTARSVFHKQLPCVLLCLGSCCGTRYVPRAWYDIISLTFLLHCSIRLYPCSEIFASTLTHPTLSLHQRSFLHVYGLGEVLWILAMQLHVPWIHDDYILLNAASSESCRTMTLQQVPDVTPGGVAKILRSLSAPTVWNGSGAQRLAG